jgi:hypothetical protein
MPIQYEPQPPPRNVSNLRLFWIIWCCLWAGWWFLFGIFTFFLGWLLCPVALACILLPIGKAPRPNAYYVPPQAPDEAYLRWQREHGEVN